MAGPLSKEEKMDPQKRKVGHLADPEDNLVTQEKESGQEYPDPEE